MYAYIDRKKNYLLLLYSVQLDSKEQKDILEIFDLAEEIKVSKTGLKKIYR
jgi:DNA-directed RNA polymerase subunit beta